MRLPDSPSLRLSFFLTLCLSASVVALLGASTFATGIRSRPVGYLVQTIPAGQSRSFSIQTRQENEND